MFIETRFFDSGSAEARLSKTRPSVDIATDHEKYDYYIDEVTDLQEWIEDNLEIELDDIVPLVLGLDGGGWVNISNYV